MNTEISYLYRDASNYKRYKTVIVEGDMKFEDIKDFLERGACDGNGFIPGQVDLPWAQTGWEGDGYAFPTEDDHVYCEIDEDSFELTDKEPTIEVTATQLIANFKKAHEDGWDCIQAMHELGIT